MVLWTIIIAAVIILDQATKALAIAYLPLYETFNVIPYLFNFRHIKNTGAAWGMFSDARWVFLIISSAALIAMPIFLYKNRKAPHMFGVSLSLVIGGAAGNMIDRLFAPNGGVTDFIEFAFMDFPVFNVADIAVCIGAAVLFVYLIFFDKTVFPQEPKKEAQNDTTETKEEKND